MKTQQQSNMQRRPLLTIGAYCGLVLIMAACSLLYLLTLRAGSPDIAVVFAMAAGFLLHAGVSLIRDSLH